MWLSCLHENDSTVSSAPNSAIKPSSHYWWPLEPAFPRKVLMRTIENLELDNIKQPKAEQKFKERSNKNTCYLLNHHLGVRQWCPGSDQNYLNNVTCIVLYLLSVFFLFYYYFFTQPLVAGFELHKLRMQIQMVWISKVQATTSKENASIQKRWVKSLLENVL